MECEHPEQFFPALGMILSGGHSTLLSIQGIGKYTLIGQTIDDAMGEAFDKVAKMLGLGYPGGPRVEEYAQLGNPKAFPFRAGIVKEKPYSFSFSGLKTAVLYAIQSKEPAQRAEKQFIADICASFQHAAFSNLAEKLKKASVEFHPKALFLGGGVTQNKALRLMLQKELSLPLFWPSPELCLDNAAMIAGLGFHVWRQSKTDELFTLEPITRIEF
jgi:N6-L-threonylcarbamoyladenine synthase